MTVTQVRQNYRHNRVKRSHPEESFLEYAQRDSLGEREIGYISELEDGVYIAFKDEIDDKERNLTNEGPNVYSAGMSPADTENLYHFIAKHAKARGLMLPKYGKWFETYRRYKYGRCRNRRPREQIKNNVTIDKIIASYIPTPPATEEATTSVSFTNDELTEMYMNKTGIKDVALARKLAKITPIKELIKL